jgi:hypothetical protein
MDMPEISLLATVPLAGAVTVAGPGSIRSLQAQIFLAPLDAYNFFYWRAA